jgi:hypothetical protein
MNWKKVRLRDVLNPKKWWIVVDAYIKKAEGVSLENCKQAMEIKWENGENVAEFWCQRVMGQSLKYAEKVVERAQLCAGCVENGSCLHCGCSAPENMYSMINECSAGVWPSEVL